ncbi:MAG: ATP-binding protein [Patescibacteria group bacterium]
MARLYLLMGYPGAGKTTAAQAIREVTGAEHVSSDAMRIKMFPQPTFSQTEHDQLYRHIDREVEHLLKAGKDVIYDANLNRHRHRQEKYAICERTGTKAVLIWVQAPKELAKSRAVNQSRAHLVPQDESPAAMFNRIARLIEEPHPTESYISMDGTQISPEYVSAKLKQK